MAILSLLLAAQAGQLVAGAPDRMARIDAARRVAFPHGIVVNDHGESRHFDEHRLLDAPFGPVLVSVGYVEMGAHSSPGVVAVHYLRSEGAAFAVRRVFPRAVETGSQGGLSNWSVSRRFTDLPAIYTEGGGTWQGYTCAVATLTELRPDGPVEVAVIPFYSDNAGATDRERARRFDGHIVNIRPGVSFDVQFAGTARFTEHYVYRNGRFVRPAGESRAAC